MRAPPTPPVPTPSLLTSPQAFASAAETDGRWTPALGDIRCDEDYEKFYSLQAAAGRRLPPPLLGGDSGASG